MVMKKLLDFLEKPGEEGDIRPWVWVVLLFVAPNVSSNVLHDILSESHKRSALLLFNTIFSSRCVVTLFISVL